MSFQEFERSEGFPTNSPRGVLGRIGIPATLWQFLLYLDGIARSRHSEPTSTTEGHPVRTSRRNDRSCMERQMGSVPAHAGHNRHVLPSNMYGMNNNRGRTSQQPGIPAFWRISDTAGHMSNGVQARSARAGRGWTNTSWPGPMGWLSTGQTIHNSGAGKRALCIGE